MKRRRPFASPAGRSPAWRRLLRGVRVTLFVFSLVTAGFLVQDFVRWMRAGDLLRVREVELVGATRVRAEEIGALAQLATGASMFGFDPAALRAEIQTHPWVRRASVQRILPDRVRIEIEERVPVALVLVDGDLVEMDGEGVLLPARETAPGDLPIVSGARVPHPVPWGQVQRDAPWSLAAGFVREVEALVGAGAILRVSELHLDVARREVTVIEEGGSVMLFSLDAMVERLPDLFAVFAELDRRNLATARLDLRFRDQVVAAGLRPMLPRDGGHSLSAEAYRGGERG